MALVLDKLVLMSSLHETQPTIQRLLSGNEFSGRQIMLDTVGVFFCDSLDLCYDPCHVIKHES